MPAPHSGVLIKSPLCQFAGFHGNLPGSRPPPSLGISTGPNVESGTTEASVGVCREEQLEWGVQLPILQMRTFGEQKLSDLLKTPLPSGAKPGLGPVSAGGLSSCFSLNLAQPLESCWPGAPGDRSQFLQPRAHPASRSWSAGICGVSGAAASPEPQLLALQIAHPLTDQLTNLEVTYCPA